MNVAVILAAGQSKRLGRPKQLLQFEGKTLIERAVTTSLNADLEPVVVCGAEPEIANLFPQYAVQNADWADGMATSIRIGVARALELNASRVVVIACDQPFVTADDLTRLVDGLDDPETKIAAAEYDDVVGIPACFDNSVFADLLRLEGDRGARDLIRSPDSKTEHVPMPNAALDIDSEEDVKALQRSHH